MPLTTEAGDFCLFLTMQVKYNALFFFLNSLTKKQNVCFYFEWHFIVYTTVMGNSEDNKLTFFLFF